jgi:hypothetical protein
MSVKTCQLCGKPLSRLRVGADPEFCSKEHRSQFRLRKGMDRLEEVNKVANLMRRRESPKQITFSSLMCQSAISPRGFFESERTQIHTVPYLRRSQYKKTDEPHITAHADNCILPTVRRHAGQKSIRRPSTGKIRIRNLNSQPMFPDARWTLPAHIVQAPARNLRHRASAQPQRREFKLLRQSGIRVHLGKGPAALRRVPFTGTEALRQGVRIPRLQSIAAKGNALRVSVGKGFSIPRVKLRAFQSRLETRSALVYGKRPRQVIVGVLNREAISRSLVAGTTAIAMRLPEAPNAVHNSQFQAQGARPPAMGTAMAGIIPAARFTAIGWTPAGVQWKPGEIHPPGAGFMRRNGAHLKRLAVLPNGVVSLPQVSFSPFIPQEPKGCPVVPFQAVIAGGAPPPPPVAAPTLSSLPEAPDLDKAPEPERLAVHFEEHFESGWDNWVGGVQDWLVDVAGVRTGSMALFMPTLDLTDYELEFLGRIDTKTINWVVRAAGEDQHIQCTLTLVPGNQLEFSRTFIKGGTAESTVVSPTRVPGKKRSTITIRTVVTGHDFAVTVDGNTVDEWAERRLPSGGVGFMGSAEDRARLYWVKVSSSAPVRSN